MNNLNNHQLILLAILVSFVTSIATGIFTVALLDQAPRTVTSTINRIVERTVETVIPSTKETIVKERVVIDKGGDLIVSAIQKTSPAIIGMYSVKEIKEGNIVPQEEGTGFFVDGTKLFLSTGDIPKEELFMLFDGKELFFKHVLSDETLGINLFTLAPDDEGNIPSVSIPALALEVKDVQVGQTAIVLDSGTIAVSFVSGLIKDEKRDSYYRLYLDETDTLVGAPVINMEEKVIGILRENGELFTAKLINTFITSTTTSSMLITPPGTTNTNSSSQIDA